MRYLVCSNKENKLCVLSSYSSLEQALKRLKYHLKKEKCPLRIVPLPEISVGSKIYRKDGTCYGTVSYETNTLWGVTEEKRDNVMPNPYNKKTIDNWLIGREFMLLDGLEFKDVLAMMQEIDRLNITVEEILKNLEYINAEQVPLFQDFGYRER